MTESYTVIKTFCWLLPIDSLVTDLLDTKKLLIDRFVQNCVFIKQNQINLICYNYHDFFKEILKVFKINDVVSKINFLCILIKI